MFQFEKSSERMPLGMSGSQQFQQPRVKGYQSREHSYQSLEIDTEAANAAVSFVEIPDRAQHDKRKTRLYAAVLLFVVAAVATVLMFQSNASPSPSLPEQGAAWSSKSQPFSVVNPIDLGVLAVDRPLGSKPGAIFSHFVGYEKPDVPLPTNAWYENLLLGYNSNNVENKVFEVPYVMDTAGAIPGVRAHACHVKAATRSIEVSNLHQKQQ